jgi:hypothetical protein
MSPYNAEPDFAVQKSEALFQLAARSGSRFDFSVHLHTVDTTLV